MDNKIKKLTGKGIKIVVVDTGVDLKHPAIKKFAHVITPVNFHSVFDTEDVIGHGTAVTYCIHKIAQDAELICVNAFGEKEEIDEKTLSNTLNYIHENIDYDIINISSGIVCIDNNSSLYSICSKIVEAGKIIVSAFDNLGAISYPAAFKDVIGVDMSQRCTSIYDYEYVEGECVNVRGRGVSQKVPWCNGEYRTVVGSSFSAGYISGMIALLMENGYKKQKDIKEKLAKLAINKWLFEKFEEVIPVPKMEKAIILPFNKEMHSLVTFSENLKFKLVGVYSYKYTGQVGLQCSEIVNKKIQKDFVVSNVEKIDWTGDFDTVVIGHLDKLSNLIHKNLKKEIIDKCLEYRKNVFSLDALEISDSVKTEFRKRNLTIYYPKFVLNNIPKGLFGKMFLISKPILGFFGTSSIQGKFTVQMEIKNRLEKKGYSVGHLTSEATGQLLGADYSFPFGYASTVEVKGIDAVVGINYLLHKIECEHERDIILVGSQSLSVQMSSGNIMYYPCCQTEMLFAIDTDAIILNVNYTDEIEYIKRTISFLESANDSVVIALALFPCVREDVYAFLGDKMYMVSNRKLIEKKKWLEKELKRTVFVLKDSEELDKLCDTIINFFKE